MFWGSTEPLPTTGRDLAIAAGAEIEALDCEQDGGVRDLDSDSDSQVEEHAPKRVRFAKSTGRTTRGAGGLPVVARPIKADYNEDDARIIQLKQNNHTDEFIAETFKQEGRVSYTAKTIGSRWQKLKKFLNDAQDEKLDDELSDWHVGEDEILTSAFGALEKKYQERIKALEEKKWSDVAMQMEHKLKERKYSAKACRERYVSLKDGSALLPIELDQDQEGRRKLREDRIAAAKQARQDAKEEVRKQAEKKKARADALKREKAEANQKLVSTRLKRDKEKRERERVKAERNNNRIKARREQNAILAHLRAERDWYLEKKRREKMLYQKLTGKDINHRAKKTKDGYESEEAEESEIDEFESDEEEAQMTDVEDDEDVVLVPDDYLDDVDEDDNAAPTTPAPAPAVPAGARRSSREKKTPTPKSIPKKSKAATASPKSTPFKPKSKATAKSMSSAPKQTPAPVANMASNPPPVTPETLRNPRSIMSDDELDILLVLRDLPRRGANETHAQLVARLDAVDRGLKSDDLSALLLHASEKSKGKKTEKVDRLQMADANKSSAGQMGVASTDLDFMQRYEGYKGPFSYLVDEAETELTSWWGKESADVTAG